MSSPQDTLNAARTLRAYLPDLVGDEAQALDAQLASLLEEARQGAAAEAVEFSGPPPAASPSPHAGMDGRVPESGR